MIETPISPEPHVIIHYEGDKVPMWSFSDSDHLVKIMRRTNTFYERDVLERIRERLSKRRAIGIAVDVGAYIGTHTIYFSEYCKPERVLAFEANKRTIPILKQNIIANNCGDRVTIVNKALGATLGYATIVPGKEANQGTSSVVYDVDAGLDSVEVTTLDHELAAIGGSPPNVSLIKIDVEGTELAVLRGTMQTIERCRPLLCVEVHNTKNLVQLLFHLRRSRYWISDCLGMTPTYVLEAEDRSSAFRLVVNFLWLTRSVFPHKYSSMKWYLKRLARIIITREWRPKHG